ncbi:MAG TPA: PadR family transcriptional regulator [Blastocatellia bacterium]|nr:PadR family transcriptional regulator [Blastocatellia bacterium]
MIIRVSLVSQADRPSVIPQTLLANRKGFRYYIRARYIVDGWSIQGEELNNCEEIMGRSAIEPADLLPLTPAVFHILLALADGERHGYGIMQEVEARTRKKVRLGPGTLYGSIKRMIADNLIEESEERPDPALDDERRRYYKLTRFGRMVAIAEAERLENLVGAARAKKLLRA